MPKKSVAKKPEGRLPEPRRMTQCDVIRYSLRMPERLKAKLKREAASSGMDMSSYICGVLAGEIARPLGKKKG